MKVHIKWGKRKFEDIEIDTSEPPLVFKSQVYTLTNVPVDRQKIMGVKGGVLKDDADWAKTGLKDGSTLMLMGTAEENTLKEPVERPVFEEDLTDAQKSALAEAEYPAGLENLGNTCYLNSCLQCMRYIPELRTNLANYFGGASGSIAGSDTDHAVTCQIRDLMLTLDASKKAVTPMMFVSLFRQAYPQFAQRANNGGFAQQDADECMSTILTTLKRKLPSGAIDNMFNIEMEVKMKCAENDAEEASVRYEDQQKLTCHISAKTSHLHEGLEEGLTEVIEKRSETLGRDAQYNKSSRIRKLPEYLIVQYMRFFWKEKEKVKAKIVKPVGLPFEIDTYGLCTESLKEELQTVRKREFEKKEAALNDAMKKEAGGEASGEPVAMETEATSAAVSEDKGKAPAKGKTGRYELFAIVSHAGRSADGGHYIGWVKNGPKDDDWLKFDDEKTSPATQEDIKKLTGHGGADWHMSYLSFYRAINDE